MNIQFGSGVLFGRSTSAVAGMFTPVQFGALQDVDISFDGSIKDLFGQYQFPIASARGTSKITGKAKFANINANALASLFFNELTATGQQLIAINEAGTIPTTPFEITVTNAATFVKDYGVLNTLTGLPYTKVGSGTPTTGQYKVDEVTPGMGVYTFAAADTALTVQISYSYTTAGGNTITINNQLLGDAPVFEMALQTIFNSKKFAVFFHQCQSTKLSLPTKLEDFVISEFDFGIFANAAGVLGKISFPE
jgi:hypothetical protein